MSNNNNNLSLKENLQKYFQTIAWDSYPNVLKTANENNWNAGEKVTERGLKIVLSKMLAAKTLYASADKYAWSANESETNHKPPNRFNWSTIDKKQNNLKEFDAVYSWIEQPDSESCTDELLNFLKNNHPNVFDRLSQILR